MVSGFGAILLAMFLVDIAGVRVLYTGDYSREEDRHLRAAGTPQFSPDICIIEQESENHLSLHWGADPINDMVSDSVLAMVLNISREMPKVVVDQNEEEVAKVILEIQTGEVEGENEGLKERVKTAFRRIQSAVRPNPSCFLMTLTMSSNGCHRISQEFHKILEIQDV